MKNVIVGLIIITGSFLHIGCKKKRICECTTEVNTIYPANYSLNKKETTITTTEYKKINKKEANKLCLSYEKTINGDTVDYTTKQDCNLK